VLSMEGDVGTTFGERERERERGEEASLQTHAASNRTTTHPLLANEPTTDQTVSLARKKKGLVMKRVSP